MTEQPTATQIQQFQRAVLDWYDRHGRTNLPWQQEQTPYRVWVSETMLQQTQVATVIPYFQRFTTRFPTVHELAAAPEDDVLHLWTGLGYYARARNLHRCAREVVSRFDGSFPTTVEALAELPGIGRSTAGAIVSLAQDRPAAILDGNVKRVLARYHAVSGWPGRTATARELWALAEAYSPAQRCRDYTQAMMDLGATLCTRRNPDCGHCPLAADCRAHHLGAPERYPEPKPKKQKPEKPTWWLLLQLPDQRCLLHRRPPSGLWGGLYCFPEFDSAEALQQRLQELPGAVSAPDYWLPFRHTFTHFHLDIHPVHVRLSSPHSVQERDRWVQPALDEALGLAAPTRLLLDKLTL
ncbi:A/G-specific adenine glycosylase [Natronospirillum operosum]|uniref:Adenine DNA glycosylase n=1 Tax=Natronospirillum operosum TaxID=2759953 RepID=A0A4Z0W2A9_9GAMM|nr:A/G-specific adenine glycosylase [Natronospirillum operosum]TGG91074.1 A/G-specific adenine glycosylase [Natronospirillum operosum]